MDRTLLPAPCPYCSGAPCRCVVAEAPPEPVPEPEDWAPWWGALAANA
ncbi:MAG TPA: hypothetical protein VNU66_13370 [Mycobacteriales bacterium]|nr:hypothetical protein [Mycobacteriales bacterium]